MTERDIQNALYYSLNRRGHWAIIPNVYIFAWESDMFSILRSGRTQEIEIKTSKSDYKADFTKTDKHTILETGEYISNQAYAMRDGKWVPVTKGMTIKASRPNYFYYCCPEGLIEDVPKYAGLMYVYNGYTKIIKRAPLLHKKKYKPIWLNMIIKKYVYRYWKNRADGQLSL